MPAVSTTEPYEAPIISAVSAALGAELEDVYRAVLTRRRTVAEACINTSGWKITGAELDDLFDPGPDDDGTMTTFIDQLITEFSQPPAAATNPATQTERQRVDQIVACMDQAEATYPNPNEIVLTAIAEFDTAVSAQVRSDRRVVQAQRRRDDCAASHGVNAQPEQDPLGVLSQQVSDVQVAAFEGGSTARATAVDNFRALRDVAVKVQACYNDYDIAVNPVVDEIQQIELAARPDLIPSILQQTSALMEQYRALLPD